MYVRSLPIIVIGFRSLERQGFLEWKIFVTVAVRKVEERAYSVFCNKNCTRSSVSVGNAVACVG